MAADRDDAPDRVRLEVGLQLRFHRHRAGLSQTVERSPANARTRDERSRIRGSVPAGRGRGRGF